MKIRSYKGPSLESIYDVIQRELGPEAVVVSTRKPQGIKSLLPSFLGGESYEIIAVADDAAAERHTLSQIIGHDDFRRLSGAQSERWRKVETSLRELREDFQRLSRGMTPVATSADGAGALVGNWDARFLQALRAKHPSFFNEQSRDERCRMLSDLIPTETVCPAKTGAGPRVVALVGPTGSGKTTTLAKLAARWSLNEKLKVGLITTDTFRIAAVDQLKEYATLLGLELKIAFSAGEAARAVKAFADKDVILVDTAGRNHYDQSNLTALRGVLNSMGAVTVLLMVPAAGERSYTAEMIGRFNMLKPNYLVLTKADETRRHEALTVAISESACPVAFVTDGQRVPQDIRAAAAPDLAELLVPKDSET